MKRIVLSLAIIAIAAAVAGQSFDLSIDTIMQGPAIVGYAPSDIRWSSIPAGIPA